MGIYHIKQNTYVRLYNIHNTTNYKKDLCSLQDQLANYAVDVAPSPPYPTPYTHTHKHTHPSAPHTHKCLFQVEEIIIGISLKAHEYSHTRVLQKILSLGSGYFNATFYQIYFYYKPSKYSPFTETHFCNLFTQS